MSTTGVVPVSYVDAARRHFHDAGVLSTNGRQANAGQLLGFAAECGVKAILVACGVPTDSEGSIHKPAGIKGRVFREHWPVLNEAIVTYGHLIPDGRRATSYLSAMPSLGLFTDWLVDHRYWVDAALPAASLPNWQLAAGEVMAALDQAKSDGVL